MYLIDNRPSFRYKRNGISFELKNYIRNFLDDELRQCEIINNEINIETGIYWEFMNYISKYIIYELDHKYKIN